MLLENLNRMSELCCGAGPVNKNPILSSDLDIAGRYLLQIQYLHEKCLSQPHFKLHPDYGGLLPAPSTATSAHPRFIEPNHLGQTTQSGKSPRLNRAYGNESVAYSIPCPLPTSTTSPRSQTRRPIGLSPTWYTDVNLARENDTGSEPELQNMYQEVNSYPGHDAADLLAVSNRLMDQEFYEMDRIITLDGMDFELGFNMWDYAI